MTMTTTACNKRRQLNIFHFFFFFKRAHHHHHCCRRSHTALHFLIPPAASHARHHHFSSFFNPFSLCVRALARCRFIITRMTPFWHLLFYVISRVKRERKRLDRILLHVQSTSAHTHKRHKGKKKGFVQSLRWRLDAHT